MAQPLPEIALDLDQLCGEAEAGGHRALAAAIGAAARQAREEMAAEERAGATPTR